MRCVSEANGNTVVIDSPPQPQDGEGWRLRWSGRAGALATLRNPAPICSAHRSHCTTHATTTQPLTAHISSPLPLTSVLSATAQAKGEPTPIVPTAAPPYHRTRLWKPPPALPGIALATSQHQQTQQKYQQLVKAKNPMRGAISLTSVKAQLGRKVAKRGTRSWSKHFIEYPQLCAAGKWAATEAVSGQRGEMRSSRG